MAYEFAQFSLPENRPGFFKIVGSTVAICLFICLLVVKFYPALPEDQIARDSATAELRNAQNELKQAQSHLDALKIMKASGQTTAPWGTKEIQIDNAIKFGGASIDLIKHRISSGKTKLDSLEEKRALGENEKLKTGGLISIIVGAILGWVIWLNKSNRAMYEAVKADMAKRGHSPDFQIGSTLVDSKAKVIAFVDLGKKSYDLYSIRDILGWEHQWTDKRDSNSAKTRQVNNVIVFKTNNPTKPLYKVPVTDHQTGEMWMARIGAIING